MYNFSWIYFFKGKHWVMHLIIYTIFIRTGWVHLASIISNEMHVIYADNSFNSDFDTFLWPIPIILNLKTSHSWYPHPSYLLKVALLHRCELIMQSFPSFTSMTHFLVHFSFDKLYLLQITMISLVFSSFFIIYIFTYSITKFYMLANSYMLFLIMLKELEQISLMSQLWNLKNQSKTSFLKMSENCISNNLDSLQIVVFNIYDL